MLHFFVSADIYIENKQINTYLDMKKIIRLTESDLHRIVKESLKKVINEIGDTNRGMYNLGRLQRRAQERGNNELDNRLCDYYEKNWKDNSSGRAFNSGYDDQWKGDKDTINRKLNSDYFGNR